jgi:hypothetical protein
MRTYRFLIWGIGGVLAVGAGTFAVYNYDGPRTRFEAINYYYGRLLHRKELEGVRGPHYWKDGGANLERKWLPKEVKRFLVLPLLMKLHFQSRSMDENDLFQKIFWPTNLTSTSGREIILRRS